MKITRLLILYGVLCFFADEVTAASVTVNGQSAGPTPFISNLQLTASPPDSVKSIKFVITPKPGSVTRPLAATYTSEYLKRRGYYNSATGDILLPVFGLYHNYSNTATLTSTFTDSSSEQDVVMISTSLYTTLCGYTAPTVVQARTNTTTLSYDYILIRNNDCGNSPLIIDTDSQVRWVGTVETDHPAQLFQNSIYFADGANVYRIEFDGTFTSQNYSSAGVIDFHHNIDIGKRGLLFEVDTAAQYEAIFMEMDGLGNILKTWDMSTIISAAMTAGGDDPTQFVKSSPNDWFHQNATAYKPSDDSLLVSSRENFVIAIDYETNAIKWILGDTTKHWFQFPSLASFSLALGPSTLPPIGQHALSITKDDNLLLFDNGANSLHHIPAGANRNYSAARKYQIDTQTNVATEIWNFENGRTVYSPYCSSVYEDAASNYLVDYAILGSAPNQRAEILGLDASGTKIFHYRYPNAGCNTAYNSVPIHLEDVRFTTIVPPTAVSRKMHGLAPFDVPLPLTGSPGSPGVECRSGGANNDYQVVATFAVPVSITSATVTPGSGGTGSVAGVPAVAGNQVTVNLTNVSNQQILTVNLIGVNDGSNTENITIPMGVLVGDVNASRVVTTADKNLTKAQALQPLTTANFRRDVNASGDITTADTNLVKSKALSRLD